MYKYIIFALQLFNQRYIADFCGKLIEWLNFAIFLMLSNYYK